MGGCARKNRPRRCKWRAPRRLDDLNPRRKQFLTQVLRGADAVVKAILMDHLLESLTHGLQVAPRQAAIGQEALSKDEQLIRTTHRFGIAKE